MTASTPNDISQQALDDDLFSLAPRHPDSRLKADWLFLYNKLPPDKWFGADYAYKTSGWLKVHTNIRKRQRILTQISDAYISGEFDWSEYRSQILKRINMHVLKLHQHHGVEDEGFFPEFVSMYPKLAPAFEILGHDHEYLNELLDKLQIQNDMLARSEVEDKALAEELHKTLVAVTDLLQQHLTDEEDLVIPILGLRQW
ncbi:hemerythrin domain-containing protein [uncultured Psychrobacter sp.]|jgi:hemerythrin-like domain-containing protein|uniref:hemerythrin domain-containing protein n=1 Tax=uncultured Psychrobacter sp. TaxID=259303 RepID=UPI002625DCC6|nr:hemerythrin domain-containing protein [uncultured Psychrobacter sp.]|tara:strand:+ start:1573 stop:2172 length:600 start_codon:yes stop_codon:yes gene_type:complete